MARTPWEDEDRPLWSVGQVAEMLEVRQAFLRRLDAFDVVSPARSASDQRRYSRRDIDQVQDAVALVDEGMTLAGVKRVFELQQRVSELEAEVRRLRARR